MVMDECEETTWPTTQAEFLPVDYLPCNPHAATKLDVVTTVYVHLPIVMLANLKLGHPFSLPIWSG